MSESVSILSLAVSKGIERAILLLSSHGRPGLSRQVSGVALPYTERTVNVDINLMSETVNTTHRADQSTCL